MSSSGGMLDDNVSVGGSVSGFNMELPSSLRRRPSPPTTSAASEGGNTTSTAAQPKDESSIKHRIQVSKQLGR